jgi:cytochrome b
MSCQYSTDVCYWLLGIWYWGFVFLRIKPFSRLRELFFGSIVMGNTKTTKGNMESAPRRVLVWDLPTRLFHWLLVVLVIISFVTANIGGNAMRYHEWSGFTILALLLFRLAWGFIGSRESRFMNFVRGPSAVFRYATTLLGRDSAPHLGHNPLGGWSIIAMLFALFVQAATGLFANDDIITEGPLFDWISKATSDWLTRVHKINREVIIALVSIHVLAVLFYLFFKHENLVKPMVTGVKNWRGTGPQTAAGRSWIAAVVAGMAALAVYLLVR